MASEIRKHPAEMSQLELQTEVAKLRAQVDKILTYVAALEERMGKK